MAQCRITRLLSPDPDGVETVFYAPTSFLAGSSQLMTNGLLPVMTDPDGWTETNPLTGEVTLSFVALAGDRLMLSYIPA